MLKITHFSKTYLGNSFKSADNISIELKKGEIFGLLGPNGAGKSTIIKGIVGITPFDEGNIKVGGISIKDRPLEAKKLIGYVSDNHAVFERLTGREYVCHIASIYGVPLELAKERTERYLDIFKIRSVFDRQIKDYSHGMKQKISVIASLVHNPKLWLLDEPITGLDPQSSYQLKQVIREHAKGGNTVIFSSHILVLVENLCDRIGIIKDGKLQGVWTLADIVKKGCSLEQLFMDIVYPNGDMPDE
jgi:ABC-2 type transport system ATP-binding protein